ELAGEIHVLNPSNGGVQELDAFSDHWSSSWKPEAPSHNPIAVVCGVPPKSPAAQATDAANAAKAAKAAGNPPPPSEPPPPIEYELHFAEQFLPWSRWNVPLPWGLKSHFG